MAAGMTFHQPLSHSIPKLKPTGQCKGCSRCGKSFGLFRHCHHCRNCGNVACSSCTENRVPLAKFGYFGPVRVCDHCMRFLSITELDARNVSNLPTKTLQEYIAAYNLPAQNAIEKGDLVSVIQAHKPLSEAHELYFRANVPIVAPVSESSSSAPVRDRTNRSFGGTRRASSSSSQRNPSMQQQAQPIPTENMPGQFRDSVNLNADHQARRQTSEQRQHYYRPTPQPQARQSGPNLNRPSGNQYTFTHSHSLSSDNYHPGTSGSRFMPRHPQTPTTNNVVSPSAKRSDNPPPSIHSIVRSKLDVSTFSVRTLKDILVENCVDFSGVVEKSELVDRVERLMENASREMNADVDKLSDEALCKICCDAVQNCVMLECGHMSTCMDCGKKLQNSVVSVCPICRERIVKLVRVFRS